MKTKILKLSTIILLFNLIGAGCEKEEELPPNHAKGKIIAITGGCYSERVLIEVENPKDIGLSGSFSTIGGEIDLNYKNAIGVPYFSKMGIPDSIPQIVGTWLYFEYRELTGEERGQNLFSPYPPIVCQMNIIPPSVKNLIISEIIEYK